MDLSEDFGKETPSRNLREKRSVKTVLGQASAWTSFWKDYLEFWGCSEANFYHLAKTDGMLTTSLWAHNF